MLVTSHLEKAHAEFDKSCAFNAEMRAREAEAVASSNGVSCKQRYAHAHAKFAML
jgi:hypothetical protein